MRSVFYSLSLLFVLGSGRALAQANFRPGYIIPLGGDTVRGKVDYSSSRVTYQCRFRPATGGEAVTYEPRQLQGFGFPGDRFYQAVSVPTVVPLEGLAGRTQEVQRLVFLEVLVQGPATLYYRADDDTNVRYYVRTGQNETRPLTVETRIVTDEKGSQFRRERPLFRGELADAFGACPEVQRTVATVPFTQSGLIKVVRQYNDCVGGRQVMSAVAAPQRRQYFGLEAMAGAQVSTLSFEGDGLVGGTEVKGDLAPAVGLALQLYAPVLAQRLRLRVEALYARQRYSGEQRNPRAPAYASYQQVQVSLDQLRVPLLLRYYPLNTRLQPFVEAGGSFSFNLTSDNLLRYSGQPGAAYNQWAPILPIPRKIEVGLGAGLGLNAPLPNGHFLGAMLRAERSNGFSDATGLKTTVARYFFLLSYDLSGLAK